MWWCRGPVRQEPPSRVSARWNASGELLQHLLPHPRWGARAESGPTVLVDGFDAAKQHGAAGQHGAVHHGSRTADCRSSRNTAGLPPEAPSTLEEPAEISSSGTGFVRNDATPSGCNEALPAVATQFHRQSLSGSLVVPFPRDQRHRQAHGRPHWRQKRVGVEQH